MAGQDCTSTDHLHPVTQRSLAPCKLCADLHSSMPTRWRPQENVASRRLWREARQSNAAARDFTVNALLYDLGSGNLYDYCGGVADCAARQLRSVQAPVVALAADPARILRALRLSARARKGPMHLVMAANAGEHVAVAALPGSKAACRGRSKPWQWTLDRARTLHPKAPSLHQVLPALRLSAWGHEDPVHACAWPPVVRGGAFCWGVHGSKGAVGQLHSMGLPVKGQNKLGTTYDPVRSAVCLSAQPLNPVRLLAKFFQCQCWVVGECGTAHELARFGVERHPKASAAAALCAPGQQQSLPRPCMLSAPAHAFPMPPPRT